MKLWLGFTAMFKKELILMRRYFVNSIGGITTLYLVFMLMFWGYRGIAGVDAGYGDGIDNLVVGYVTWFMLMIAYQTVPHTVLQEAQEGTIEQLYMSPLGFVPLVSFKLISGAIVEMIIVVVLLILITASTGTVLNIDIFSLLPLIVIAIAGVSGIGFIFGGITLLFKRIQSYLQIIQFGLIGLVAAPETGFMGWLPVVMPSHWIRQVMVQNRGLAAIPAGDWLMMLLSACLSLIIGVTVFKFCENKARLRGTIGHF